MNGRPLRLLKVALAFILMASVAAWQPSMTLAHASAPPASHQHTAGHHPSSPPSNALPDACCDMCVAACGACPGLPGTAGTCCAAPQPSQHGVVRQASRAPVRVTSHHLHPLPLGPPQLRDV